MPPGSTNSMERPTASTKTPEIPMAPTMSIGRTTAYAKTPTGSNMLCVTSGDKPKLFVNPVVEIQWNPNPFYNSGK